MSESKAKAKGRKIGRGTRKNSRYRSLAAKKRRLLRNLTRFPRYRAPGWELKNGVLYCTRPRGGA